MKKTYRTRFLKRKRKAFVSATFYHNGTMEEMCCEFNHKNNGFNLTNIVDHVKKTIYNNLSIEKIDSIVINSIVKDM